MSALPWHPSQGPYVDVDLDELLNGPEGHDLVAAAETDLGARRADCCIAAPAYRVVLPATTQRPEPAELLLCGHHTRSSLAALNSIRAGVFDAANRPITSL